MLILFKILSMNSGAAIENILIFHINFKRKYILYVYYIYNRDNLIKHITKI